MSIIYVPYLTDADNGVKMWRCRLNGIQMNFTGEMKNTHNYVR